MKPINIMLDLETWGTKPGSVITSIGAVVFNDEAITDTFYARIDPKSAMEAGLLVDADTILWWMKQSDEARAEFSRSAYHIETALADFSRWCLAGREGDPVLWGNGATFDNALLRAAYEACGIVAPWGPFSDRCYRTAKSYRPGIKMARTGTHHNALDDARSQAEHLIRIHKAMGVTVA